MSAPKPVGPYTPIVRAGDWLIVSGQVGVEGGKLPDGVAAQTAQAVRNVAAQLATEGAALTDVAKTLCFLTDMGDFATFNEPGYVKIIWTLRADPISPTESIVRTDTRVATTDRDARAKFRLYWAFLSPGIVLIRKIALAMVKREAERFASQTLPTPSRI